MTCRDLYSFDYTLHNTHVITHDDIQGPPWQSVYFGVKILGRKKYSGLFTQWISYFQKSTFHLQK